MAGRVVSSRSPTSHQHLRIAPLVIGVTRDSGVVVTFFLLYEAGVRPSSSSAGTWR